MGARVPRHSDKKIILPSTYTVCGIRLSLFERQDSCNVGMLVLTVDPRVFSPGTLETSVSKFQFYS